MKVEISNSRKFDKYVEIKQYIRHQPKCKRIIHREIGEFTEMKKTENTQHSKHGMQQKQYLRKSVKYKSPC